MHNVTEKWTKYYQTAGKPWVELAELNSKYLNKITEQARSLHETSQARKPEDLISAGVNAFAGALNLAADHWRKASEITVNGLTEAGKAYSETLQEVVGQASCGFGGMTGGKGGNESRGSESSRQQK